MATSTSRLSSSRSRSNIRLLLHLLVVVDALQFNLAVAHTHIVAWRIHSCRAGEYAAITHTEARTVPGALQDGGKPSIRAGGMSSIQGGGKPRPYILLQRSFVKGAAGMGA